MILNKFIISNNNKYLKITNCLIFKNKIFNITINKHCIHHRPKIEFKNSYAYTILQYFRNNPKKYITHKISNNTKIMNKLEIENIFKNKNYLSSIDINDLLSYMLIISDNRFKKNYQIIVKNVDDELCNRLNNKFLIDDFNDRCRYYSKIMELLKIIDTILYFINCMPNYYKMKSYDICINNLKNIIKNGDIKLSHFIQCIFYLSTLKNDQSNQSILKFTLNKLSLQLNVIENLTLIELSILCNSYHKYSLQILSKPLIDIFNKTIEKYMDDLLMKEFNCLGILKILCTAKYHNYSVLDKISKRLFNNYDKNLNNEKTIVSQYTFTQIVYLLKLYSNAFYGSENFINYLADEAITKLEIIYKNEEYIRAKDVSILLKSLCQFGFDSLKQRAKYNIYPIINDVINNNLFEKYELKSLSEIILWFCIMGDICDKCFLEKIVSKEFIKKCKSDHKNKTISRMNLLITILSIEKLLPDDVINQLMELIEPASGYETKNLVNDVHKVVEFLAKTNKEIIKSVEMGFQIPNLFIPGITVQTTW